MRVIVDTREPDIVARILKRYYQKVEKKTLDYGDIEGMRIIAERKSVNDLVQSTFDGRVDRQSLGLASIADEKEKLPVILVHGSISDVEEYVKTAHDIIAGQLASLKVRYGFEVVWMPNLVEALIVFAKMDRKIIEGKLGRPRKPRVRYKTAKNRQAAILATLLSIPQPVAEIIIGKGGLRWLLEASDEEILRIPGIGPKTLKRLKTWLMK